jgi:hypothetical protein
MAWSQPGCTALPWDPLSGDRGPLAMMPTKGHALGGPSCSQAMCACDCSVSLHVHQV